MPRKKTKKTPPSTTTEQKNPEFKVPTKPGILKKSTKGRRKREVTKKGTSEIEDKESESDFSFEEESSVSDASVESSSDLSSSTSEKPLDEFASGVLEISLDSKTKEKLVANVEAHKKKVTEIKLSDPRGVIFLGHLPYGFFEKQLKIFFNQFGVVTRIKLSRNKKSGKSKHYAFIEFMDPIVAKIVADTMHGYIMFSHVLVCKVIPPDQVHPKMFSNSNKCFVPKKTRVNHAKEVNKVRTAAESEKRAKRLLGRESQKRKKLLTLGIDYNFPGFKDETLKQKVQPALVEEAQT